MILNKKKCKNPKLIEVLTQTQTPHTYVLPLFFSLLSSRRMNKHILSFSIHHCHNLNEFYKIPIFQKANQNLERKFHSI